MNYRNFFNTGHILVVLLAALMVVACEKKFTPKIPDIPPIDPSRRLDIGQRPDISGLPYEQGVKAKYSKLILECTQSVSVNSEAATRTKERATVKWDLLKDTARQKTFSIREDFEGVKVNVDVEIKAELGTMTYRRDVATYYLRDALVATGEGKSHTEVSFDGVNALVLGGDVSMTVIETAPADLLNQSWGPTASNPNHKGSVKVTCALDSVVKPGFAFDVMKKAF